MRILGAAAAALGLVTMAGAAHAGTAVGLVGDKTIVVIDTTAMKVTKTMTIDGIEGLHGLDLRPSNKMVYLVALDGSVHTVDVGSGKTTKVSTLDKNLPSGAKAIVDFNPKADKLRFMGTDGTNLRADVETGAVTVDGSLAFEGSDPHAGMTPSVVAAAYSNSYGKPETTAMYDIDAGMAALLQQVSPNDGKLKGIGKLGLDGAKAMAFDIETKADGTNTAWLVADNALYSVDLSTGKATKTGDIAGAKGMIRDITVLPSS